MSQVLIWQKFKIWFWQMSLLWLVAWIVQVRAHNPCLGRICKPSPSYIRTCIAGFVICSQIIYPSRLILCINMFVMRQLIDKWSKAAAYYFRVLSRALFWERNLGKPNHVNLCVSRVIVSFVFLFLFYISPLLFGYTHNKLIFMLLLFSTDWY